MKRMFIIFWVLISGLIFSQIVVAEDFFLNTGNIDRSVSDEIPPNLRIDLFTEGSSDLRLDGLTDIPGSSILSGGNMGIQYDFERVQFSCSVVMEAAEQGRPIEELLSHLTFCLGTVIGTDCKDQAVVFFENAQLDLINFLNSEGYDGKDLVYPIVGRQYCLKTDLTWEQFSQKVDESSQ